MIYVDEQDGEEYGPYNTTINKNYSDWKEIHDKPVVLNTQNIPEMIVDLSDATIQGS